MADDYPTGEYRDENTQRRQARHGRRAWEDTHPSHPGRREISGRQVARGAARAPGRVANAARVVTQRSDTYSGKGMLTALLLAGFVIVAIRLVADYELQEDGSAKGNVLHPQGQYGPMAICAGLIGSFFFLSLVAMGGGTRAKLAVIMGSAIVLTLGVKSYSEVKKVGSTFGNIGKIAVPPATGQLPDIYGNAATPGSAAPSQSSSSSIAGQFPNQATSGPPLSSAPIPFISPWVEQHTPDWLKTVINDLHI